MARIISLFLALFIASAAVAAPLNHRQTGDAACNADRLNLISQLVVSGNTVNAIDTSDNATATAVASAKAGLNIAGGGITEILLGLITGQAAPASSQDAVTLGLDFSRRALAGITNPAVNASVAAATAAVQTANDDGNAVARDCA
ncbi:hypothetical protein DFH09DRAFT_1277302 [Mycena vulgaris]|nr:hypothetical protein DFH09DRAFT_1277302 [Mycena vulgaris]